MGKKDVALIRYFQDESRYIDLINAFLFQGRQVMKPENVQELDSTMNGFKQIYMRCSDLSSGQMIKTRFKSS